MEVFMSLALLILFLEFNLDLMQLFNIIGGIPFEFEQSVKNLLIEFDKAFPELADVDIDVTEFGEEKTFNLGNLILFGKLFAIQTKGILFFIQIVEQNLSDICIKFLKK